MRRRKRAMAMVRVHDMERLIYTVGAETAADMWAKDRAMLDALVDVYGKPKAEQLEPNYGSGGPAWLATVTITD